MAYEARRGTDEQRYKYLHGGRFGDRDLYDVREQKYGVDDHYRRSDAANTYRPGFRTQVDEYEHGGAYGARNVVPVRGANVYGSRGVGGAGGYDTGYPVVVGSDRVGYGGLGENLGTDYDGATYGGRHPVPPGVSGAGTQNLVRDRDGIASYGPHASPAGGLRGIDYGHDLATVPPTYHSRKNYTSGYHDAIPAGTTVVHHHHHPQHHREVYYEEPSYSKTTRSSYTTTPVSTTTRVISGPTTVTKGVHEYSTSSPSGVRRSNKTGRKKWNPLTDMGETDKYWVVRCEIPGVRKDKLSVQVEGKDLIIRGKRVKELWNADRFGGSSAVSNSPAVVPVLPSGSATPTSGHHQPSSTTTTTTSPGGTRTTTSSSSSTTVIKSDESGVISRDQKASVTNTSGVTHGSESHQTRNPDGTLKTNRIAWVDKERGGHGVFKRKVRLPARVDQSAVTAMYKDGVLEVLVRKPENVEKRKGDRVTIN